MDKQDNDKGNILITYLFASNESPLVNIDNEGQMKRDLQELAEKWKKKGFIRRYVIAGDDIIGT